MADARQFNVRDGQGRLLCPCCGWADYLDAEAYDEAGAYPAGLCPCCLWQLGFDDDPFASSAAQPTILASLHIYRAAWRQSMTSPEVRTKPERWDGEQQLVQLLAIAPHLR